MTASKQVSNPGELGPTEGRYSHIVKAQCKSILFVSGQVSSDNKGRIVGRGNFRAQAEQVLRNLNAALASQGATPRDVVKITVYVTDMKFRNELQAVRSRYFPKDPPAATMVEVSSLAHPDYMVEIEAMAVLD